MSIKHKGALAHEVRRVADLYTDLILTLHKRRMHSHRIAARVRKQYGGAVAVDAVRQILINNGRKPHEPKRKPKMRKPAVVFPSIDELVPPPDCLRDAFRRAGIPWPK